ncbi:MAG: murein biosynthesis integral membrane protein MurJ [Sedimentisphaerales bacterium]|nr:murein biosynthesis integral membrane protein MurJ [Sedimentisphaerales bacterium]
MIKGFRQIASLTALSRVLGFVRDAAYSHFFGAGALLDAWSIAFKIPNLSRRLFGEGAASASFIPVYSEELHKNRQSAKELVNTVVTVLFVILAAIILIGEGLVWGYYKFFSTTGESKMVLSLTAIMLPYMLPICIVAILGGILNVHRHFAMPAAAPIVLNLFIIAGIPFADVILNLPKQKQVFLVAVTVLIAGVAQVAVHIPALVRRGVSIRPAWQIHSDAFRKIIILMGPMILGLAVTQINTLADDLIAWWFSGSAEKGTFFMLMGQKILYPLGRGSVSHLYFSQRLYQLPLGVFGISLATAIFPVMSAASARKDFTQLGRTVSRGFCACVFISIPATIGLVATAKPLIAFAFQHGRFTGKDTNMVVWTLLFYTLGLLGYFSQQVIVRAFYSMQNSKTPVISALIAVAVNVVLNLTLMWFMGTGGLALSTAFCSYLQVVILTTILHRQLGSTIFEGLAVTLAKTTAATLLMSAAIIVTMLLSKNWPNVLKLALMLPVGTAVYLAAAKALKIEALSIFTGGKKASEGEFYDG